MCSFVNLTTRINVNYFEGGQGSLLKAALQNKSVRVSQKSMNNKAEIGILWRPNHSEKGDDDGQCGLCGQPEAHSSIPWSV